MENGDFSVLIVDDNPRNLQILGTILRQAGYYVEFAINGKVALEWIKERDFDVILLDIMMPEMDGFETCAKIKKMRGKDHIPIIFLTAKSDIESLVKGFELGAVDYIVKPFNRTELLVRIKNHVNLKFVTDQLRTSLEKEKELGDLKTRFVSMASHEFRTPLTSILSISEIIKKYHKKMNDNELENRLNKIKEEVSNMTTILEDILIIGKSESGKLEFNPEIVNLVKYSQELIDEALLVYSNKNNIKFHTDLSKLELKIDKKWFKHIFNNLLSNAIKYSKKKTSIVVSIIDNGEFITFQFEDKGIGIPDEDQEVLFNSFHRAKNVGNIQGTGLGLSIVKKAVDLHNGTITLNSIVDKGTTVFINIPKIANLKNNKDEKDSGN